MTPTRPVNASSCSFGASEQRALVPAHEQHDRSCAECLVARMLEAPPAEKRVVREQLLPVVGGAFGEVELYEQIEGELERLDLHLERDVRFDCPGRSELDVDDRLAIGQWDLVDADRMPSMSGSDLGTG
jgi:hypothetical protein